MADPQGFLHVAKQDARKRPVEERIHDWREVYAPQSPSERDREVSEQARRCMDCASRSVIRAARGARSGT